MPQLKVFENASRRRIRRRAGLRLRAAFLEPSESPHFADVRLGQPCLETRRSSEFRTRYGNALPRWAT